MNSKSAARLEPFDPTMVGSLAVGGLVFAIDQGIPLHEDRYGLVERFVKDHRAVLLSSSSSNWGGAGYVRHYDGYSFLLDDLVLESDLLICTAIGNNPGSSGMCGSWAKNALIVVGVNARGSLRRENHRYGHHTSGPAPDGRVKPDCAGPATFAPSICLHNIGSATRICRRRTVCPRDFSRNCTDSRAETPLFSRTMTFRRIN